MFSNWLFRPLIWFLLFVVDEISNTYFPTSGILKIFQSVPYNLEDLKTLQKWLLLKIFKQLKLNVPWTPLQILQMLV